MAANKPVTEVTNKVPEAAATLSSPTKMVSGANMPTIMHPSQPKAPNKQPADNAPKPHFILPAAFFYASKPFMYTFRLTGLRRISFDSVNRCM